ncbi:MAG: hypothetical protein ABIF40_05490 [archaeon]
MENLILWVIVIAVIIESVTILSRYLFGSIRREYKLLHLHTHIHHGYIGLLFLVLYIIFQYDILFLIGGSLFLSDFIHHFIVLKIWIRRTEFP